MIYTYIIIYIYIYIYRLYVCTHKCTICISDIVHDPLIGLRSRCILPVVSLEQPFDMAMVVHQNGWLTMEKPIYKWMITRGSPISGNLHINAMSQDPTILRHCGDNPPAVNKFMALLIARPNFLGLSHSYLQEPQDSQVPASK
jgi:hypothetical protein